MNSFLAPWRTVAQSASAILLLTGSFAQAGPTNQSGTTLAAYKTLDVCIRSDGNWNYSGLISVWNSGTIATTSFQISDHIQSKISGSVWTDHYLQTLGVGQIIPPGTTQLTAMSFPYSMQGPALTGDIRNVADVTITNHSAHLNTAFGPSPKATYTSQLPPPQCSEGPPAGCTYTRGYWGNKPGVTWPAPYSRDAIFYYSGTTYGAIIQSPAGGNAYYILGPQFIAAELNVTNGAFVPTGVQTALNDALAWFNLSSTIPATCSTGGSCGTQKAWAKVLDDFNNGIYPGGPSHCGDEILP